MLSAGLDSILNVVVSMRLRENTRRYKAYLGNQPNYATPRTWTEKMQWRKAFDRNPIFPVFCDKLAAREYVRRRAPDLQMAEVLWSGHRPEDLPFDALSPPFIVKPSHRSRAYIKVLAGDAVDRDAIVRRCHFWLKRPYGTKIAEWAYQKIKGQVIVERYLTAFDQEPSALDFRFFCFSGRVAFVQIENATSGSNLKSFVGRSGEHLELKKWRPRLGLSTADAKGVLFSNLPASFPEMIFKAEQLAVDLDHLRVDFYSYGENYWFSELTVYGGSGYSFLHPTNDQFGEKPSECHNMEIGELWNLPELSYWQKFYRAIFR